MTGTASFTLHRNAGLRYEYGLWNSPDGLEFQAALKSNDCSTITAFEISWDAVAYGKPEPRQNLFANTKLVGYKFMTSFGQLDKYCGCASVDK